MTATDPNAIYKQGFRELAELLNREPTVHDAGWVELHNAYSRSWAPAEETVKAPRVSEPLSGPDNPEIALPAVPEPLPPREYSEPSERGFVVASHPCRKCGLDFEKPARKGRPPVVCEGCR